MLFNYHTLPHQGIQRLKPYIPGKSIAELINEQGLSDIIKLASNENMLGCSLKVQEALKNMSGTEIAAYPAPNFHPLKAQLCKKIGLPENQLSLCNGSDFLFTLLMMLFALHQDKHILTHDKAFSTYHIQAETLGIPVITTPIKADWQVDMPALIEACDHNTAIIFLANPNNPTGLLIAQHDIHQLLQTVPPTTIVVIDEAYYEYAFADAEHSSLPLLKSYPNLVITRTFSKAYGLAGLRLGYALTQPSIYDLLQKIMLPFTVNEAAMTAGAAALGDEQFVQDTLMLTQLGLHQLQEGLKSLSITVHPTHCNFVIMDCGMPSQTIYQKLLEHGIITRPLHAYNLPNHLRVTTGTPPQNERFLEAVRLVFN